MPSMAFKLRDKWAVKYREDGKEKTALFLTREEAELWQAERKHTKRFGPRPATPSKHLTFVDAVRKYYKERGGEMAETTKLHDLSHLNVGVIPVLGHLQVDRIGKDEINKLITISQNKGNKNATINRRLNIVRAILRYILEEQAPKVRRLPNDYEVIRPPSAAEAKAILANARPHLQRAIYLGCWTGARPGASELYQISWEHIDWDTQEIWLESAKKGGIKQRTIPIHPALFLKLKAWYEDDGRPMSGPIIRWGGKPVKTVIRSWRKAVKDAGISRRLRPYDMRHYFATQALAAGADPGSVASVMGSDVATIQEHYQHILDRAKRQAVEKVGSF